MKPGAANVNNMYTFIQTKDHHYDSAGPQQLSADLYQFLIQPGGEKRWRMIIGATYTARSAAIPFTVAKNKTKELLRERSRRS